MMLRRPAFPTQGRTFPASPITLFLTIIDGLSRPRRAYLERRSRRALWRLLHEMSDRSLKDIGLTRADIDAVACGRFEGPYDRAGKSRSSPR